MTLKEIQDRNHAATVRRGRITDKTTDEDYFIKLEEEINELNMAVYSENQNNVPLEMADIIIVVLNFAKHLNIDIQAALIQKTYINENRKD